MGATLVYFLSHSKHWNLTTDRSHLSEFRSCAHMSMVYISWNYDFPTHCFCRDFASFESWLCSFSINLSSAFLLSQVQLISWWLSISQQLITCVLNLQRSKLHDKRYESLKIFKDHIRFCHFITCLKLECSHSPTLYLIIFSSVCASLFSALMAPALLYRFAWRYRPNSVTIRSKLFATEIHIFEFSGSRIMPCGHAQ